MYSIGVVGYMGNFDEKEATEKLREAFQEATKGKGNEPIRVVSGLTNEGVLALAYQIAQERGWRTAGVACEEGEKYPQFNVDDKIIKGKNWGDESQTFLDECQALIRIGGGNQSRNEAKLFKQQGKGPTYEYEVTVLNKHDKQTVQAMPKTYAEVVKATTVSSPTAAIAQMSVPGSSTTTRRPVTTNRVAQAPAPTAMRRGGGMK